MAVLSVAVVVFGAGTSAAVHRVFDEGFVDSTNKFVYGDLGMAAGIMTLLTIPVLCVEPFSLRVELLE